MVADGSSPDIGRKAKKWKPGLVRVDPKPEGTESEKQRSLFYQFLEYFRKENGAEDCFSPFPPMLGDGQRLDLFKLYMVVRDKGGYDAVSRNGLWDLVAQETGLGSCSAPAVKLVYAKYIVALERRLFPLLDGRTFGSEFAKKNCVDLGALSMDLGGELEGFLRADSCKRGLDFAQVRKSHHDVHAKNELIDLDKYAENETIDLDKDVKNEVIHLDEDENGIDIDENGSSVGSKSAKGKTVDKQEQTVDSNHSDGDGDSVMLDPALFKGSIESSNIKVDSAVKMLNWITKVAKDPCCPAAGSLPDMLEWERFSIEEPWKQILLFREVASLRSRGLNSEQICLQKNQKMHPSIYEDQFGLAYNLRERLSSAKKVSSGRMTPKDNLNQLSGTQREFECSTAQADKNQCDNPPGISMFDHDDKKKVPIGPRFQAGVPIWVDSIYESDPKWLGTQIWPLDRKERISLIERDPIGRGRKDSCGCQNPGSIKCVQFHISEKRSKVKLELGSAFQHWSFHMMGEVVSTTWKEAEKKTFKTIVESTAPPECFWDQIYKKFPTKSREVLVSYYYNVFLLQRRAHQNRNAPNDIDSDDEESAWSLLTADDSGGETSKSKSILCTPKKKTQKKSR